MQATLKNRRFSKLPDEMFQLRVEKNASPGSMPFGDLWNDTDADYARSLTLGGRPKNIAGRRRLSARDRVPSSTSPDGYTDNLRAFRQGLKDVGYVEGENVAIEYRWADNQIDRLPVLAADLVRRRVAVIVSGGAPASVSAAKAATTVPIVFMVPKDQVRLGLVTSLARPGGN